MVKKAVNSIWAKIFIGFCIGVGVPLIIWYGAKPLANEINVERVCVEVDSLKTAVELNTDEIADIKDAFTGMDKKVSNQTLMIKLLLQKEGIELPREVEDDEL